MGTSYSLYLPSDPFNQDNGTEFWLFTEANQTEYEKLDYQSDMLNRTKFNPKCDTIFLVHGYTNNGNSTWVKNATEALFEYVSNNFEVIYCELIIIIILFSMAL